MKIYFLKPLYNQAMNIIELKGTADDIKAANDLAEIRNVLYRGYSLDKQCTYEKNLHNQLNREYPEIKMIGVAASNITLAMGIKSQNTYTCTLFESIKQDLLRDTYGICASVLLKHGIIESVEDFIEKVD